jgi:hypothetical protein
LDAQSFLKIPRIGGMSRNPKFPGWIPITDFWFGDVHERNMNLNKSKDTMTFVADVTGIKISDLNANMRTGEMVSDALNSDDHRPAKFAGFYDPRVTTDNHYYTTRVASAYIEMYGAVVSSVFVDGGTITFTLKGTMYTGTMSSGKIVAFQ